jgi:hypothetical protein
MESEFEECTACLEDTSETLIIPCGHAYCRECLRGIITVSLKNRHLWPPGCCQEMQGFGRLYWVDILWANLPPETLQRYHEVSRE